MTSEREFGLSGGLAFPVSHRTEMVNELSEDEKNFILVHVGGPLMSKDDMRGMRRSLHV